MTQTLTSSRLGRREVIVGAGVAALAATFAGPGRGLLDNLPFVGGSAEPFNRSPLSERIGERFRVVAGAAEGAIVEIREIVELPVSRIADAENQFAVRFAGIRGSELVQGTYEFATDSFGRLPLFVTPLTVPGAAEPLYEAIVNRITSATAHEGGRP